MKRKIAGLFVAIFVLLGCALPVSASVNDARNGVVVVAPCVEIEEVGTQSLGWGTGFFVGVPGLNPMYLATNYHVVEGYLENGAGTLVRLPGISQPARAKVYVHFSPNDRVEAYIVTYDEVKDLAVLKLAAPTSKREALSLCKPDDSIVGSEVCAIGYPGLAENLFAGSTTSWGTKDVTVTGGRLSRIFTESGTGRLTLQIDCDIKHGNSGGPLVNENGDVIGVNTGGVSDNGEKINYAVSIEEVMTLLDKEGISYNSNSTKANIGVPGWTWGILAAIVVILIVVVLRQIKKEETKKPFIRSLSPQHNGLRICIENTTAVLGRDPLDCSIVYQKDTPGVGRHHCSVTWDASVNAFVVTDLGSTYGTYRLSGQRLTPNVPYAFNAGEQFYLAERTNTLELDLSK